MSDRRNTFSRRQFLAGLGSLGALAAWAPVFRLTPASAQTTCAPPPDFPTSIELYQQAYENWSGEIKVDELWTCAPRTPAEVVEVANWAHAQSYRVRARGSMHNWSPLTITPDSDCGTKQVLVDTTQHLSAMQMASTSPAAVKVQTGALMDDLLVFLEQQGCGFLATPAPGDVTVGGVLAIDAHGTGIPAVGETRLPGHSYGTLSNAIVALTAVVWNAKRGVYELRTFERSHAHCKAFLTHLGRAFIIEVTLRVGPNYHLRCQSYVDIAASELLAAPGALAPRNLASYLDSAGRMEVIWFPFTTHPWLKVWSVSPTKPLSSREVDAPYNYPFSDNIPREISDVADQIIRGNGALTPQFGQMEHAGVVAGLKSSQSEDIWGLSKNLLLYVRPTTLRVGANGYAIVTSRGNVQRVVSEFAAKYESMLKAYQARGLYPINGPVEIRVTGLDQPADVGVTRADAPALSAARPRSDRPEWDVAVWLDLLTFPGTPNASAFYREFETWLFQNYSGSYAMPRPEWSKGWGYSEDAAWADPAMLGITVPECYRAGKNDGWTWAVKTLNAYDPHRIFSNPFLDVLLP